MPPAKRNPPASVIPVDAITHADKRANLPTADAYEFVVPEVEMHHEVRYPRDPSLDPQLVWKGKDVQDSEDLVADAPPIYIQEKIDPRVIIDDLRKSTGRPQAEPLRLFDTFDGLDEMEIVDFYRHQANWSNRMILGDSLNVMASLAEREALRGKVQMIYIDPPYGIKFGSNWQASVRKRDVKDGRIEDISREVEQIKAFRDTWELGIHSYLTYLRDRLTAAKDLLVESGSIFVQIGDENVHLVRAVLDETFGSENFLREIVVAKTAGLGSDFLPAAVDFILWYARSRDALKSHPLHRPKVAEEGEDAVYRLRDEDGRLYRIDNLTSANNNVQSCLYTFRLNGREYRPAPTAQWKTTEPGMKRLLWAGRLHAAAGLYYKRYVDDFPVKPMNNLWADTGSGGFVDEKYYVVQTNTKIVERCILLATDPSDLVLDPTCGSGTTAFAAERWGRRWITIDSSRVALALARQRLMGARFPWFLLEDSLEGRSKEEELGGTRLPPAEVTNDIRHGFVYQRVPHVTLKSIATNPDIHERMTSNEINAAIRGHSDSEELHDRPFEDNKRIRVTGPFTVESLSPHRSLAFAGSAFDQATEVSSERRIALDKESSFEETVIANLRIAGIQNGRRGERLTFDTIEPYASSYIQWVGERTDAIEGAPKRVGVTIGPHYGTVGPSFIKDAAREAIHAADLDLLCVLAFAFEPQVVGTGDEYRTSEEGFANVAAERQLGRVPVLLVRMNADLVMGEELKKTGAGNLFTVFGEPDIEVRQEGDDLRVVLKGVDVYDPNTGQVRSNDVDQVALWMIDTAYNEESFFVRQCYFTGGQDPYARLKRALKADVDEEAWASLNKTESRPFPQPTTGKIAVKVINDYGDEVMKVFSV